MFVCGRGDFVTPVFARRIFRGLPYEQDIHVGLEEAMETIAHVLFLITACLGFMKRLICDKTAPK